MQKSPGSATVLVVDDTPHVRLLVSAMLNQAGYRVFAAADGAEALAVLNEAGTVDLVLADVMMPVMGGPELARRMAEHYPEIRVAFMSGYSEGPDAPNGSVFLPKPFTASTLFCAVRQALELPWPVAALQ